MMFSIYFINMSNYLKKTSKNTKRTLQEMKDRGEKIPSHTATKISDMLKIPTIGIAAGSGVDGQVLVIQDVMGMNDEFSPKFLRRYADLHTVMSEATRHYIEDVKSVSFPNQSESY